MASNIYADILASLSPAPEAARGEIPFAELLSVESRRVLALRPPAEPEPEEAPEGAVLAVMQEDGQWAALQNYPDVASILDLAADKIQFVESFALFAFQSRAFSFYIGRGVLAAQSPDRSRIWVRDESGRCRDGTPQDLETLTQVKSGHFIDPKKFA